MKRVASPAACRCACAVLGAVAVATGPAQEVDTVLFRDHDRKFTVLDQIAEPGQRTAVEAILRATAPRAKLELAERYLSNYPDSPLLAAVSDIAAKSSIDLGALAAGTRHARLSLEILPENPLLLVALADALAAQGRSAAGAADARRALYYLDRFDKPARFSDRAWKALLPRLRATCHAVLGRASLDAALEASDEERTRLARRAARELERARGLARDDSLAAYLLGLAEAMLGNSEQARIHLADAARAGGAIGRRAGERLREIPGSSEPPPRAAATRQPPKPSADPQSDSPARYAGSAACRDCHERVYDSWRRTGMARMFRPADADTVLGDFSADGEIPLGDGASAARVGRAEGRPYIEVRDSVGRWLRRDVDYAIGSKWQQAYAAELPDGRIQVFPIQYNLIQRRWLNFWRVIDPPGTERVQASAFHRASPATNYQINCASCHTSQLRARGSRRPVDFAHGEPGVNCEMCHGPSADHARDARSGTGLGSAPPVRFEETGAEEYVDICGRCHMQSNLVEIGPGGEVNYTGTSRGFYAPYKGRPIGEFSTKAAYRDGRFRETTFIGESFVRSQCHLAGGAHCGHCHDPHPGDPAANPKSLKFPDDPDRMCLQCHGDFAASAERHTRHPADSEASRCASCHMPRIMHALLFAASTHRIDNVPDAGRTLRFGREESPNACLLCHEARDDAWLQRELADWPKAAG